MAYATRTDMEARYPAAELIERTNLGDPDATEITGTVLDRALADASAEMDDYFDPSALPIDLDRLEASSRERLVVLCCRIARKNLYFDAKPYEQKPQWRIDYDDAISALERHRKDQANLLRYAEAPAPGQAAGATTVRTSGNRRVFSRDRLRDW